MKKEFNVFLYCVAVYAKTIILTFVVSLFIGLMTVDVNDVLNIAFAFTIGAVFVALVTNLSFMGLTLLYQAHFPYQNKTELKQQLHLLGTANGLIYGLVALLVFANDKDCISLATLAAVFVALTGNVMIFIENQWGAQLKEIDTYPTNVEMETLIHQLGEADSLENQP